MTTLDPDRLLPADPGTRAVARELYAAVAEAPILSPHGHVPAGLLLEDRPFGDPAELFITRDHYVTRLLHAHGVGLPALGVGSGADPREVWRIFAEHADSFAGTASAYWIRDELATVFGIEETVDAASADRIHDEIAARLAEPAFRPRALFDRFRIEVLATTDDPLDDLAAHAALRADPAFRGRVLPTFRPDRYLDPDAIGFPDAVDRLLGETGERERFDGYLRALQQRREHFLAHGAVSLDIGVAEPWTLDLDSAEASALFDRVRAGDAGPADRRAFRGHMLLQMARMSVEDGLVMTLHAGVLRNHSSATLAAYGPDTGHDIPVATEYTRGLRPLLERYGLEPGFHLVLFAVDETVYSRELAPLAGFYPSVFIGAPWWFLDAPDAIQRWRSAITETAGFFRTSGFIDDTRAFLSIPARHDAARRADSGFLARSVREGRIDLPTAERIARALVDDVPRRTFKLGGPR
ncbi:glucuronate isomerase [Amnibacterium sp. CER49]|uniref:glucuronate isomerase n=1 Tax=Amnibacterium sp. CER49 TaxID=3039161 RepID=UPI0024483182|nr:glucuronate isomerase [Amnibacterium sp. CER49]MDH2443353.1 glucuronate isomerase [Amnibacterium sp. CER49]